VSLDQVFAETNVRMDYLQALEHENFESLHLPAVNVRGYLTAFANAIGLAAEEVVPAYMQRFTDWQSRQRTR
jgi:cytoskeletal protein RodZ